MSSLTTQATIAVQATEASVKQPRELVRHINDLSRATTTLASKIRRSAFYGTYAERPSAKRSVAGTRYVASDGLVEFVNDGAEWRPMIGGVVGTEVSTTNFSLVGSSLTSKNLQGGTVWLYLASGVGNSIIGYEKSRGSAASIVAHMRLHPVIGATSPNIPPSMGCIWVRDTSSGKLVVAAYGKDTNTNTCNFDAIDMTNLSTFSSTPLSATLPSGNDIWLRIKAEGSSIVAGYSFDGINFFDAYTDSTTFLGAGNTGTSFGFGLNAAQTAVTFDSVAIT